jgi:hypothetical protein
MVVCRDDSITKAQMIHCCKLLARHAHRLRHLTHGSHIIVTRYYMVKSDGTICIPWDLTFGEVGFFYLLLFIKLFLLYYFN